MVHPTSNNEHNMPLVSIGLPVFNGERFLRRALASLVTQDYGNFELIISDNLSTDGTLSICRDYAARDGRVRIIEQTVNAGALANFRAVVEEARGEYFMWAADDDIWAPGFIRALLTELQDHPDACVAMCATTRITEAGQDLDTIRFTGRWDPNGASPLRLVRHLLSPYKHNLFIYGLFRTATLKQGIGHFPDALGGDRQFLCQFALAGAFRYRDQVLYTRTHRQSHEDDYRLKSGKILTIFEQLWKFWLMLVRSPLVPMGYKLISPLFAAQYALFLSRRFAGAVLRMRRSFLLLAAALAAAGAVVTFAARAPIWLPIVLGGASALFMLVTVFSIYRMLLHRARKRVEKSDYQIKRLVATNEAQYKDLRYLADLLLFGLENPVAKSNGGLHQYLANRQERLRKAIKFARAVEDSRIRELFFQEIFDGTDKVVLPIGAINELTGHPNKTDMLYVCATAKIIEARRLFEFGTYRGRTTYHLTFASEGAKVTTLNLPPQEDDSYGQYIGSYFRGTDRERFITQIYADSREFDVEPNAGQFDFVFVDADHSYAMVKNDTQKALRLLKPGGIIMWHDYAPKSEGLVDFFRTFTQTHPVFRIRRTCLLLYIDGVDPMTFLPHPMPPSLELEAMKTDPYQIEELYHA